MHTTIDGNTAALDAYQRAVDSATEAARASAPLIEARSDELRAAMARSPLDRAQALESITECEANGSLVLEAAQDIMTAILTGKLDSTDHSFRNARRAEALVPLLAVLERCAARACLRMAEHEVLGESLSDADVECRALTPAEIY
ncbi:MAG: hypothetical protein ACR2RL_21635 [Gammaproteobacteria bacterium]